MRQERFLNSLSDAEILALPYLFEFWALPHQMLPEGAWGRCRRIALVGETVDQVREVMIFGESGILACSPPDRRRNPIARR